MSSKEQNASQILFSAGRRSKNVVFVPRYDLGLPCGIFVIEMTIIPLAYHLRGDFYFSNVMY